MIPIGSSGFLTGVGLNVPPVRSDADLLARYQTGEQEALDEPFRRYRQVAYRVAYRVLHNEADALDAVQDGFIKALVHLDSFEGRSSFKTWLLRVVSNAALDLGRQHGRQELLSLDAVDSEDREGFQPLTDENPGLGL